MIGGGVIPPPPPPPPSYPPLQLASNVWTPNRASGDSILDTDWPQLPANSMVAVAGSSISPVLQPSLPNYNGGSGTAKLLEVWCGAAWSPGEQAAYVWAGGGHQAVAENDNAAFRLLASTLTWSRIKDRSSNADRRSWNTATGALQTALGPEPSNVPQADGAPGTVHTYDLLQWVPPGTPGAGSVLGGLYLGGWVRCVLNLDTGAISVPHWFNPTRSQPDWSYGTAVVDGSRVLHPTYNGNRVDVFDLAQSEATDWAGGVSLGRYITGLALTPRFEPGNRAFGWLRERREYAALHAGGGTRVRYGQALDAGATNWAAYTDAITVTSTDGSHADLTVPAFDSNTVPPGHLYAAGLAYDPPDDCLWLVSSVAGGSIYKVSGIAGNTWTMQRVAGATTAMTSVNGTFGRWRITTRGGVRIGILIPSSATANVQVVRLT